MTNEGGLSIVPQEILDFELELAMYVGGKCNKLGYPLNIDECNNNIFVMM